MAKEYFDDTAWMESEYADGYRQSADHFVLGRRMQLFIVQSFYRHFLADRKPFDLLDLGCGDGELAAHIVDIAPHARLTMVDGSADMLSAARERFSKRTDSDDEVQILQHTFAELIADPSLLGKYDMVVSGFAIHHLYLAEKTALFEMIHRSLKPGGAFVNIDTVFPSTSPALMDWYYACWREWIEARQSRLGLAEDYSGVPDEARYKAENKLSTLSSQLEAMKSIGFTDVGCHYQNGIFVVFSGMKAPTDPLH
jgi:tRNA (cmo5U34)-methyltransferase